MVSNSVTKLIKLFNPYLQKGERIISVGVFRKIPSVSAMIMTRCMARFFTQISIIAVTDKRVILLPESKRGESLVGKPMDAIGFDDVSFSESFFYSTMVEIRLPGEDSPLRLRFSGKNRSLGLDKNDFIGAVYQGKKA